MIPRANITAWRSMAPWATDAQVEQDLVISRALVDLYRDDLLARELAFRGGTALQKLHFDPPVRYSEDIDLVQVNPGPIGPVLQAMRTRLDPWLGEPRWKQSQGRATCSISPRRSPPCRASTPRRSSIASCATWSTTV